MEKWKCLARDEEDCIREDCKNCPYYAKLAYSIIWEDQFQQIHEFFYDEEEMEEIVKMAKNVIEIEEVYI